MSRRKAVRWPEGRDVYVDVEFLDEYDLICSALDGLRFSISGAASESRALASAIEHLETGLLWLLQAEVNDDR